jgi:hypothetical protein
MTIAAARNQVAACGILPVSSFWLDVGFILRFS